MEGEPRIPLTEIHLKDSIFFSSAHSVFKLFLYVFIHIYNTIILYFVLFCVFICIAYVGNFICSQLGRPQLMFIFIVYRTLSTG